MELNWRVLCLTAFNPCSRDPDLWSLEWNCHYHCKRCSRGLFWWAPQSHGWRHQSEIVRIVSHATTLIYHIAIWWNYIPYCCLPFTSIFCNWMHTSIIALLTDTVWESLNQLSEGSSVVKLQMLPSSQLLWAWEGGVRQGFAASGAGWIMKGRDACGWGAKAATVLLAPAIQPSSPPLLPWKPGFCQLLCAPEREVEVVAVCMGQLTCLPCHFSAWGQQKGLSTFRVQRAVRERTWLGMWKNKLPFAQGVLEGSSCFCAWKWWEAASVCV